MKPAYVTLKSNHSSSDFTSSSYLASQKVYTEVGYAMSDLIRQNAGYANTCAIRMSVALLKSGVHFNGRMKIKSGRFKGNSLEPGAKALADELARSAVFGRPNILKNSSTASAELQGHKGVVFFWKITGYGGGHIDLLESSNKTQICNSHCYFACKEIWFWDLL